MTRTRTMAILAAMGMALLAGAAPARAQRVSTRIEIPKPIPLPALPKPLPLPRLNTANPVLSIQSQTGGTISPDDGLQMPGSQITLGGPAVTWGGTAYHYGAFPSLLPGAYFGMPLQTVLQPSVYTVVAVYGLTPSVPRYLVGVDTQSGWVRYAFDIRAIGGASLGWLQSVGNVLYISYVTPGVLTSGAILAFDLTTGRILWNSPGQISNAPSFVILGSHLITGWGGATGPGYLYVLDRRSGRVLQKATLDSAPRSIVARGKGVTVRSRAKEYRFSVR